MHTALVGVWLQGWGFSAAEELVGRHYFRVGLAIPTSPAVCTGWDYNARGVTVPRRLELWKVLMCKVAPALCVGLRSCDCIEREFQLQESWLNPVMGVGETPTWSMVHPCLCVLLGGGIDCTAEHYELQ